MLSLLSLAHPLIPDAQEIFGKDVGLRVVQSGAELVEELYAVRNGMRSLILVSPTHPTVKRLSAGSHVNLLQGTTSGLFSQAPTLAFTRLDRQGNTITLTSTDGEWKIEKRITVPTTGQELRVELHATTDAPYPQIRYLLNSYAFAPGKPDTTFAPAIRPATQKVIGDHFFRSPLVMAQKGALSASLMPDLDVLTENRPIPTIIDLDCKNGVVDAPLLSYGFCDYRLVGHVYFANDASMVRSVPGDLRLGMAVFLDADTPAHAGYSKPARRLWEWYGHRYFEKVLPQAMPFAEYAEICYPAAFNEKMTGGWFEKTIDGHVCGGVPSGWGLESGWVSWQGWFNQLRSAWGLRWWGKKLNHPDWVDKADKMLNLALAAPMKEGAAPTTYLSRTNEWRGSLIMPSPDCYYDLTNIAWKGLAMLKWLEFTDCPRREEIERQLLSMAELMLRVQNKDGSFPTWLTKDLKVVPALDHSAQSALPTWFLAKELPRMADVFAKEIKELIKLSQTKEKSEVNEKVASLENRFNRFVAALENVLRSAEFLQRSVVPKSLYYDFETFFSCSPKECFQRDGVIDDLKMWDLHTMQAPQNTLSMQWCAEALRAVSSTEFRDLFDRISRLEVGRELSNPRSASSRASSAGQSANGFAHSQSATMGRALQSLDVLSLYQNVWPISYRKVAYTYGGFGVQNSDGEYNDARQAQFGVTLCDFGAQLGRRDYFERGVAAIRASLTLINHPLHEKLGIYPNPNYPLGLEPENNGHGGTDQQNGRTGFDWGEGSGLASAAMVLDKYGSTYKSSKGWSVLIDGGTPPTPKAERPTPNPFDFTDWRMPGWTFDGDFLHWPTRSVRLNFNAVGKPFIGTCEDGRGGFEDEYTGTITSPKFLVTKPTIKLLVGGGSGEGVYVELLDANGKRIYVERGRNTERMDDRTWDVSAYQGQQLQIRIVDHEKGGWGHINVGNIRAA